MKLKLALYSLIVASIFSSSPAFAVDTPTKATLPKSDIIHSTSPVLHVSGGLTMYPIGDKFFALLPKIPHQLETPEAFLKNHITGVTWQVSDSRNLGEEHQFGLSLKSPADSASDTPTLVHFSGMPKVFKLNDTAKLEFNEKGSLTVSIGKETYPVLLKKDMVVTSAQTSSAAPGLATTETKKPAGQ